MIHESQVKTLIKKISSSFLLDGDPCSNFCLSSPPKMAQAKIFSRNSHFICGLNFIKTLGSQLYPNSFFKILHPDNTLAKKEEPLLFLHMPVHQLIQFKELSLYFLSRMSSIASLAKNYTQALEGSHTKLSLPHFFTPHMSLIEKEAFYQAGVETHKRFFKKTIAIKQEHIFFHDGITSVFNTLTESLPPTTRIEIHVKNLEELKEATTLGPDLIVLENFDKPSIQMAERMNQKRSYLELTGDLSLEDVKSRSHLGLDFISSELIIKDSHSTDFYFELIR